MGKTKYTTAKQFVSMLKAKNGEYIPFAIFIEEIRKVIGADEERTIRPYVKLMMETKLISKGDEYGNTIKLE